MQEIESVDWQAMRYVLGEMTPADAADFEDRLAADQAAREAVAAAVEVAGAVAVAARDHAPQPLAKRRASFSRVVGQVCLAAAACLFVVLAAQSLWRNPPGGEGQPDRTVAARTPSADTDVAQAWHELRARLDDELDSEPALASNDVDAVELRANLGSYDLDDEADVPWWMIVGTGTATQP